MEPRTDITFSIHSYNRDGDRYEEGIFLHFGNTRVLVAAHPTEFIAVADKINGMAKEIAESFHS